MQKGGDDEAFKQLQSGLDSDMAISKDARADLTKGLKLPEWL